MNVPVVLIEFCLLCRHWDWTSMKEIWKRSTRNKFIDGKLKTNQRKEGSRSHDRNLRQCLFSGCVSCDLCICMLNHRLFPLMLVIFKTFLYFSICDRVRPLMLLLCWRWYCRNLPYVALELNVMVHFFFLHKFVFCR